MRSLLFGKLATSSSTSATNYQAPSQTTATAQATENVRQEIASSAGTMRKLRISLDTAPGVGKSYTFKLRVNGADSALVVTISDANTTGVDSSNSVSIAQGDLLSISVTPSGTPTGSVTIRTCLEFTSTVLAESMLLATSGGNAEGSGGPHYIGVGTAPTVGTETVETNVSLVLPVTGTLKNLFIGMNTAPGAGTNRVFAVMINGVASGVTCTVADSATSANDTSNTVSVTAGDLVSIRCTNTGSTASTTGLMCSLTLVATTDGQFAAMNGSLPESSSAANYFPLSHLRAITPDTQESLNAKMVAQACSVTAIYANLITAPSSGKSRTYALRQNASTSTLSCVVTDTNTTANDTAHTVSLSDGDLFNIIGTPAGTPTSSGITKLSLRMNVDVSSASSSVSSSTSHSPSSSTSSSVSSSPSSSPSHSPSSSPSPSSSVSSSPSHSPSSSVSHSPSASVSSSPSSSPSSSVSSSPSPSSSVSSSPSSSLSPSAAPDICLRVVINNVDRTRLVDTYTLRITQVITSQPDSCEFVIKKFGDRSYKPTIGDTMYIKDDGVNVFSGVITEIDESYDVADYSGFRVICSDYTYMLDGRLVVQTFENMTVNAIMAAIKEQYLPSNVTIANVSCATVVDYAAFNYEPVSQVITQLAELVGADWYIDYYQDIHFSVQGTVAAPFNLSDTGGKYIYDSLTVRRDQTQVRNVVYVRGGDYIGSTVTAVFDGNAAQRYFYLPYKMSNLGVTVTGQAKSVGVDPLDDPGNYDAMHNFQEKTVFFRQDKIPRNTTALAASQKVRIHGNPNLPILVQERDQDSINTFTSREYFIQDASIKSKDGARQRAQAEMLAYKTTLAEAEFSTYEDNLHTGQTITVQSDLRGLNEDYVISKLEWQVFGMDPDTQCPTLVCKVSLVTKRTFGYTQLLQRLLNKDKKSLILDGTETLDRFQAFAETASGVDSAVYTASASGHYRYAPSSVNGRYNFATWS